MFRAEGFGFCHGFGGWELGALVFMTWECGSESGYTGCQFPKFPVPHRDKTHKFSTQTSVVGVNFS